MWDDIKSYIATASFEKLLPAIIALLIGVVAAKVICGLFDKLLAKSKLETSLHAFLRSIFHIIIYVIVALIVAGTLGFNVSSLVALLSVVSLAFSLAVQGALANIAGGIQILSARPFRVGDFVELDNVSGTVEEIRMVYTVISTIDNKRVFVPNSDVAAACITNYTAEGKRRVDVVFSVAYGSDIDTVKAALRRCADVDTVLKEPEVFVGLQAYKDSCIEYVVRAWCKTEDYWPTYFAIQENAQGVFEAAGIEMTYPHLNVHLEQSPDETQNTKKRV